MNKTCVQSKDDLPQKTGTIKTVTMSKKVTASVKPSFSTFAGLIVALLVPAFYIILSGKVLFSGQTDSQMGIYTGLIVMWLLAFAVMALTLWGENRPLSSIGFTWPNTKLILMALGFGVLLSLTVPALTFLLSLIIPVNDAGIIESASQLHWFLMLVSVITAGITEELLFRGYALERLLEWTNSKWISSIISLVFFTAVHITGWNIVHIVGVVIPMGIALIILYWWKRNVILVMIVHITINLPMVFIAFNVNS